MKNNDIEGVFKIQSESYMTFAKSTYQERILRLKNLQKYLLDHIDDAVAATKADFGKPEAETIIAELLVLQTEISHSIKHLKLWTQPFKQTTPLTAFGTSSYIQYEAKGCVLIIAPWNYPISLAFKPLISAISAGCVAIIKPSELTPHSSHFIKKAVDEIFDAREVAVVEGGIEVSEVLLKLPFHHIFFTGSPKVGKLVMKAAAENLTSVTLELGGKSPSIVDASVDIRNAAKQIAWAKFFNNGQTCIAPDYVLIEESVHDKFVKELTLAVERMYNSDRKGIIKSESYGRIVNDKNFDRIIEYIDDAISKNAEMVYGGDHVVDQRFISPTILTKVKANMMVMNEEIFGPILPIMKIKSIKEGIRFVSARQKPLALYIHSTNQNNIQEILHGTSSGNALVNEILTQFSNANIPFGGVNNSGIGKSNGFYGFQEFSNAKGVMKRNFGTMKFLYPPYKSSFIKLLKKALKFV